MTEFSCLSFKLQINFPLCTIAHTPRLPEHCIEYVRILLWPKENPFDGPIDGDDPNHINWIYDKAVERANEFSTFMFHSPLTEHIFKEYLNNLTIFIFWFDCRDYRSHVPFDPRCGETHYSGSSFYECCDFCCLCYGSVQTRHELLPTTE